MTDHYTQDGAPKMTRALAETLCVLRCVQGGAGTGESIVRCLGMTEAWKIAVDRVLDDLAAEGLLDSAEGGYTLSVCAQERLAAAWS